MVGTSTRILSLTQNLWAGRHCFTQPFALTELSTCAPSQTVPLLWSSSASLPHVRFQYNEGKVAPPKSPWVFLTSNRTCAKTKVQNVRNQWILVELFLLQTEDRVGAGSALVHPWQSPFSTLIWPYLAAREEQFFRYLFRIGFLGGTAFCYHDQNVLVPLSTLG